MHVRVRPITEQAKLEATGSDGFLRRQNSSTRHHMVQLTTCNQGYERKGEDALREVKDLHLFDNNGKDRADVSRVDNHHHGTAHMAAAPLQEATVRNLPVAAAPLPKATVAAGPVAMATLQKLPVPTPPVQVRPAEGAGPPTSCRSGSGGGSGAPLQSGSGLCIPRGEAGREGSVPLLRPTSFATKMSTQAAASVQ